MKNMKNKAKCDLCGEVFSAPDPEILFVHLVSCHPLEFLSSNAMRRVADAIRNESELAGAAAAEYLKGKFSNV